MKHTGRRWEVRDKGGAVRVHLVREKSTDCAQVICTVHEVFMSRQERLANGYLAAAAPELLEACEKALERGQDPEIGMMLKAAIKKARGE